ncbi:MAG: hypothetical protein NC205_03880 [Prevotella sp.]|nr:hypothetical protein [Alistipes senegalensis]MCM1357710.1 hypothetical protein [Prevotella sp.]
MQIIQNQFLCCNNLLSYKTRVSENRVFALFDHMEKSAEILNMEITGDIIFTINETIKSESKKIFGIEVLLPVASEFESNEHYVFKPKIRIENALKTQCVIDADNIDRIKEEIVIYMLRNQLKALTDFYYVVSNRRQQIVDIYVGINGSIL